MSELSAVELRPPAGEPVAVEWDAAELAELRPGLTAELRLWRLRDELDWGRVAALRVLSGRLADGRGLAIAALRPRPSAGHADDVCAGLIGSGPELEPLREVLFSTEYGPDGRPRRIGLELLAAGSELPLRVAGDAREVSAAARDALSRERVELELRISDSSGAGVLEILRPR